MNSTVIIPVAPYHQAVLPRALASVAAQTVPTQVLYMVDGDKRGPGYVRNRLLESVDTPYTVFLDADDWLEPTFIETCEQGIEPGRYVYTDWWEATYKHAPEQAYCNGTWHVITAMVHTDDARRLGGFDESMGVLEDGDFWLKFNSNKICGIHIKQALSHYSKDGTRSRGGLAINAYAPLIRLMRERYETRMGCCGGSIGMDLTKPVGERQANDVLAMALWRGNRKEYGRISQRWYPRMSNPKVTWVDPRDIDAMPNHWKQVVEPAVNGNAGGSPLNAFTQIFHNPPNPNREERQYAPARLEVPDFTPNVVHVVKVAEKRLT